MADDSGPGGHFDLPGDFRQAEVNIKSPIDKSVHHYHTITPRPERPEVDAQAAHARLAKLPVDTVPPVSTLPPCSRIPLVPNPAFVGREDGLKALAAILKGERMAAVSQIAAATGLGGIGKTQLASEFVHRYGSFFLGGVYWLSFAKAEAIESEIAACRGPRGLDLGPGFSDLPLADQVEMVRAEWERDIPRLLVFDNCEDGELVRRYRPASGAVRVLITSRRTEWPADSGISPVPLGVLSRPESVALLRYFRPELNAENPVLAAIAAALGDLPLALHLAGSFLTCYRHAEFGQPQAYLEALSRPDPLSHRSLIAAEGTATEHEPNVARTFALSYERLDPQVDIDDAALALLARAACFAPGEPIPRALLRKTWESGEVPAEELALLAEDALRRLHDLGLLAVEHDGALVLHQLLTAYVRSTAAGYEAAQRVVEEALAAEAKAINQSGVPGALLAWRVHLAFVAERADARDSPHGSLLLNLCGIHLSTTAEYADARDAFQRALASDEAAFGPDHANVARSISNLGNALRELGDFTGARDAFRRALEINQLVFGHDHPDVALSLNSLGVALSNLDKLVGARDALERALDIDQNALGYDGPEVARDLVNLGNVLHSLGDLQGARKTFQRALSIKEATLGHDHPEVATALMNLGNVLHALNDLPNAHEALQRALTIMEATYGRDHPAVASAASNLGGVLFSHGDFPGARGVFQRALDIYETTIGPSHPKVATVASNLGAVLKELGDLSGARNALQRALSISEIAFGPDHSEVARVLNNLSNILRALGDLSGARTTLLRSLGICQAVFGPDHSKVAMGFSNLGGIHHALGDLRKAHDYFQHALNINKAALSPDHPNVARDLNDLGKLYVDLGELPNALEAFQQAFEIFENQLVVRFIKTLTIKKVQGHTSATA